LPLERRISPRSNSSSENRGSRPTLSKAQLESLPFIICEDCGRKVYNKKNLTDEILLRWHQSNSKGLCGPARQIDTEMPLGCTFDDLADESENDFSTMETALRKQVVQTKIQNGKLVLPSESSSGDDGEKFRFII
jgi:hypothetical protein